ncbi:ATPase, T2SS/T4P/T4SS family [Paenibacillus bovis]|uniref:Type II secretion system protein E n=1 Tax=Paenibacillus bovis TaxID=1616788 RepID=A0A1X9T447_9BACL|nr:ATPase, T2SS/T4P/T4SS family [Paenibacillus bovis]ARR10737.1 type II secretion system protein E [Paenibacillus bovis]
MIPTVTKARIITLTSVGGGDLLPGLSMLLNELPRKSKVLVVEYPCMGIPRISYNTFDNKEAFERLHKQQSIDQLLLDFNRKELKPLHDYMVEYKGVDYLLINPRSMPDSPVTMKIKSNKTMMHLPVYLRQQLQEKYDFIIYVASGTMLHTMTFSSIKYADAAVFFNNTSVDFINTYTGYKRFSEVFGAAEERLFLFSGEGKFERKEKNFFKKASDLIKEISKLPPLEIPMQAAVLLVEEDIEESGEIPGIIDPMEYLEYSFTDSLQDDLITEDDQKNLQKLKQQVQRMLSESHLDHYVAAVNSSESEQKVMYLIADIIRDLTTYSFKMPREQVISWVQQEILKLGPVQPLVDDESVSSFEINGPEEVIVCRNGLNEHDTSIKFASVEDYIQIINKILEPIGKSFTGNTPIIDANRNGIRVNVIADTTTRDGVSARYPLVAVRKFPKDIFSDEEVVSYGNMNWEMIKVLRALTYAGVNITVAGSTDSGKTTTLSRLPLYMPKITRIMSIEDTEELRYAFKQAYRDYPNLPSLLTKEMDDPSKSIGMDKLIKAALRQRPDILVLGEVRDKLAGSQALIGMNTGHTTWSSVHAESMQETAVRWLQLNDSTEAAAAQVGRAIHIILFQERLDNGKCVVTEFGELLGFTKDSTPIINPYFVYDYEKRIHQRVGNITSDTILRKFKRKGIKIEEINTVLQGVTA